MKSRHKAGDDVRQQRIPEIERAVAALVDDRIPINPSNVSEYLKWSSGRLYLYMDGDRDLQAIALQVAAKRAGDGRLGVDAGEALGALAQPRRRVEKDDGGRYAHAAVMDVLAALRTALGDEDAVDMAIGRAVRLAIARNT